MKISNFEKKIKEEDHDKKKVSNDVGNDNNGNRYAVRMWKQSIDRRRK